MALTLVLLAAFLGPNMACAQVDGLPTIRARFHLERDPVAPRWKEVRFVLELIWRFGRGRDRFQVPWLLREEEAPWLLRDPAGVEWFGRPWFVEPTLRPTPVLEETR
jgi:hypothetical protein